MKTRLTFSTILLVLFCSLSAAPPQKVIRVLVITGGHEYQKEQFNRMFESFAPAINYRIAELPGAFDLFKPENRDQYDVLVFYHMWQKISPDQEKMLSECVKKGKPLVVLHHSICAWDDWPEYWNMIGGKYFHKETSFNGRLYEPCSYIHDIHLTAKVVANGHPVVDGLSSIDLFDETYKGFYVAEGVTPLLTTDEPSSGPVIGWAGKYGKARVVTIQSGHDVPTYENREFRKLLRQAIIWVYKK